MQVLQLRRNDEASVRFVKGLGDQRTNDFNTGCLVIAPAYGGKWLCNTRLDAHPRCCLKKFVSTPLMIGRTAQAARQIRDSPTGSCKQREGCPATENLVVGMWTDDEHVGLGHT
jgi:hypothetical protein